MPAQSESFDVAVVGGGAIGLACAWRAQQRGARVVVIDAGEPGAWNVAAGMLAPVSEAEFGERELLAARASRARAATRTSAPSSRTRATARRARWSWRATATRPRRWTASPRSGRELGLPVERLRPSQARRLEPALAPTIRLALDIEGDHSIDPRKLVAALRRAFTGEQRRGRVRGLRVEGGRVTGVELADGATISAGAVVVAAGVHVAHLEMPERARVPVRPVKGQVLRLRDPRGPGLTERTIRGESAYFVPRGDGAYVLGATMEERGWDTTPTAGGVYELLRDLSEIVPGVFELDIEELTAGLRPATPDNLPAIGHGALDGLIWATGHYRNGILLTPVTADLVAAALAGEPLPGLRRRGRPAPLRRSARMKVLLNGESAELVDGATVKTALDVARPAGRGRGVAVAVDAEVVPRGQWDATNCTRGRGWRSCARSREAEMAVTDTNTDVLTIAGTELLVPAAAGHGRLPLARRAGRRAGGLRLAAGHRRAAADRPGVARLDRRRPRPRRASSCCPTPPAASPRGTPC